MSSTDKIQLKTAGEVQPSEVAGDKNKTSDVFYKEKRGRPKKEVAPETQKQLVKDFINKLENITYDGEKYIVKNKILNTVNNIEIVKEFIPKFRKIFVYPRFNAILRSDNSVVRCLKTICKLAHVRTDDFIYEGRTNMFILL